MFFYFVGKESYRISNKILTNLHLRVRIKLSLQKFFANKIAFFESKAFADFYFFTFKTFPFPI